MRYVELFAGAGGLSMGLEAAGMRPVAHAELEPHARAVLRHHWPDTPLHGDVTQIDWAQYAGQVDLVAGGSPCQDLSVAGKRAGLAGARSGLFHELIRAWDETGATYCLWENVDGARSSNNGEDFAAVLSAFVGATISVSSDGWRSSGVAAGRTGVAAWRVLDLQHFGPPQRRRRVFILAARTGGADPAEILALSQGVCGHPSPREQSRQGIARGAAGGAGGSISWDNELNARVEAHGPSAARGKSGGDRNGVLAFQNTGHGWWNEGETAQTLRTEYANVVCTTGDVTHGLTHEGADASEDGTGRGTPIVADAVLAFDTTQTPITFTERGRGDALSVEARRDGTVNCIRSPNGGRGGIGSTDAVLAFHHTQNPITGDVSPSFGGTTSGMAVLAPAFSRGSYGDWVEAEALSPLCARDGKDQSSIVLPQKASGVRSNGAAWPKAIADTLTVAYAKKWGLEDQHINSGAGLFQPTTDGRPRRLTPLECERLMGWPDRHTAHGVREDGTAYALSDTARYRLCGNGVGTPVAAWIGRQIMAAAGA